MDETLTIPDTSLQSEGQRIAAAWITNDPIGNSQRIALAAQIDAAIEAAWEGGWNARRDADAE